MSPGPHADWKEKTSWVCNRKMSEVCHGFFMLGDLKIQFHLADALEVNMGEGGIKLITHVLEGKAICVPGSASNL
jgi:hypothetical protein